MMVGLFTGLLIFGVAYWLVRRQEDATARRVRPRDEIDRDALEQAEREVRDLGIHHHPDDGFEGDDWGPGVPR